MIVIMFPMNPADVSSIDAIIKASYDTIQDRRAKARLGSATRLVSSRRPLDPNRGEGRGKRKRFGCAASRRRFLHRPRRTVLWRQRILRERKLRDGRKSLATSRTSGAPTNRGTTKTIRNRSCGGSTASSYSMTAHVGGSLTSTGSTRGRASDPREISKLPPCSRGALSPRLQRALAGRRQSAAATASKFYAEARGWEAS